MDEETDIGLVSLSAPSASGSPSRPPGVSRAVSSGMKSPSSPNLLPIRPQPPMRRNTNPRKLSVSVQSANLSLESLSMDPMKVASLRRWIMSLAIVDFDLEVGPKISCIYPPLDLSPSEEVNIAFSSFPDSPQFEQGSQTHSFRIRVHNPSEDKLLRPSQQRPQTEDGFLYGFSQFTQRRDANSKRGYQQRSVVILTHLAYPALFYTLVEKLGPSFLAHGGPMLEAACHNMATWLDPSPGATLELGFLGGVLIAELPAGVDTQQALPSSAIIRKNARREPEHQLLVSLPPPEPSVISLFEACLPQLWSIWECLVLCEPILIYGPSPAMTSQAIWWLRDVLRPIPVAGDFRPFFTIHDADHAALVNPRPPSSGLILGVTNPYFDRACKHWPHVLSLGRTFSNKSDPNAPAGPAPGWRTKHSRYVSRDQTVLQQLQAACSGSEQAKREASALMRQHFSSRTAALLVPLQRYLQSLIPLPSSSASTGFPSATPSSTFPRSTSSSWFPRSSASPAFPKSAAPSAYPKSSASNLFPPTPLPGTFPSSSSSSGFHTPDTTGADSPRGTSSRSISPSPNPTPPTGPSVARTVPPALNLPPRATDDALDSPATSDAAPTPALPSGNSAYYTPLSAAANAYAPLGTSSPASSATLTPATPRLAPFSEKAFLANLKPLVLPFKSGGKAKEFYTRWIRSPRSACGSGGRRRRWRGCSGRGPRATRSRRALGALSMQMQGR
ncbi:uncharacterized protein B0H18DRAFT_244155 [Fomitopsis serialis]|uniref:uncharacterized protein n=1 Tax=Fomitopsis serialis TaxID=139415 RepID=UPI002008C59D|nr:uncharacterized protein B0H18DRAFT_244155 [Neoantrodia serialis]KAH9928650.1 hypothetical protein B0H18DRAFT_244155 [Neoantrodia serialis]